MAPSGPVDHDRLRRGCAVLRRLGLEVRIGEHVLDRGPHLPRHLAGEDAARARDLEHAWCDPAARAVFCARGGYGATRLLPILDWDRVRAAEPTILVGASDATALHAAAAVELGTVSLLGPMPASTVLGGPGGPEPATLDCLRRALFGSGDEPLTGVEVRALVRGRAAGITVGGTLSLLAALAGTRWLPDARGAVVVLEDVGEPAYRVDRMLTQLRQAGWFDGVAGIVLGEWVRCAAVAPVLERLGDLGVPVLAGMPFGHGPVQLTVALGVPATLDTDARTLSYDVPPLA